MSASGKSPCDGNASKAHRSSSVSTVDSRMDVVIDYAEVFGPEHKSRRSSSAVLFDELFGPSHDDPIPSTPPPRLVLPVKKPFVFPDPTFKWRTLYEIPAGLFLELSCEQTDLQIASRINANLRTDDKKVTRNQVNSRYRREIHHLAERTGRLETKVKEEYNIRRNRNGFYKKKRQESAAVFAAASARREAAEQERTQTRMWEEEAEKAQYAFFEAKFESLVPLVVGLYPACDKPVEGELKGKRLESAIFSSLLLRASSPATGSSLLQRNVTPSTATTSDMVSARYTIEGENMSAGARLMRYYVEGGEEQKDILTTTAAKRTAPAGPTNLSELSELEEETPPPQKRRRLNLLEEATLRSPTQVDRGNMDDKIITDTEASPLSPNTKRRMRFELEDEHYFLADIQDIRQDTLFHLAGRHSHRQILDLIAKHQPDAKLSSRDLSWRMSSCLKTRARQSNRHRREVKEELDELRRENGVEYAESTKPEEGDAEVVEDEIFEGDPEELKGDKLFELCAGYTHAQIVAGVKAHHPKAILSSVIVTEKLKDAISKRARREGRTYAEVRTEFDALREANGLSYRQNVSSTKQRAFPPTQSTTLIETTPDTSVADAPSEIGLPQGIDNGQQAQAVYITSMLQDNPDSIRGQAFIDLAAHVSYTDILSAIKAHNPESTISGSTLSSRLQSALKSKALHERKSYEQVRQELTDAQKANKLMWARCPVKQRVKVEGK